MPRAKPRGKKGTGTVLHVGKTWAIRYSEDGAKKYEGGFITKDEAQTRLADVTRRIRFGLPGTEAPGEGPAPRFVDLVDEWIDYRKHTEDIRSTADDRNRWNNHVDPQLGTRTIDRIDSGVISGLVTTMKGKGVSPATIERVLHLLSAFYKWARNIRKVTTLDPVKGYFNDIGKQARAKLRSKHRPEDTQHLEKPEDVARVFRAMNGAPAMAYALTALAGMRPGEALALRWSDVDLVKGKATIRRQVRHGRVSVPKSGKARTIDLVPSLVSTLKSWREQVQGAELICPPIPQAKKAEDGTITLKVRRNRHGESKFLNPRTVKAQLAAALKSCDLPAMTWYEAGRHTYGALWVIRGLDVYQLSKTLGHSSVKVTESYAHLAKKTAASVLERADIPLAG